MPLFEIVREDEVVIYQHAKTRAELERNFLVVYQIENEDQSFVVYKVDDDLNRIGRKKSYIPLEYDLVTKAKLQKRGDKLITDMFQHIFEENQDFFTDIIVDNKK